STQASAMQLHSAVSAGPSTALSGSPAANALDRIRPDRTDALRATCVRYRVHVRTSKASLDPSAPERDRARKGPRNDRVRLARHAERYRPADLELQRHPPGLLRIVESDHSRARRIAIEERNEHLRTWCMRRLDARGAGAYRHPSQVGEARPRAHGLQIQALAGLRYDPVLVDAAEVCPWIVGGQEPRQRRHAP